MKFYHESLPLSHSTALLLRDLIESRTGIHFDESRFELMADKLSPLVIDRGFGSFLDYYYLLKYEEKSGEEWDRVADALTVQETFFWREADQVRALADVIVPRYFEEGNETLKIWSAACATGEEPLSIAMALDERGFFDTFKIEIVATDLSPAAILHAREGVYRERSLRNLPRHFRERYFTLDGEGWRVREELKGRVSWGVANILGEEASTLAQATVIFCRNVFIYFAPPNIRRVVAKFYAAMPKPAYLFVAAAESLLKFTTDFELMEINGAFVYVKR